MAHQLEVIAPNGQIEFYDLDPHNGVLNIGRHPDNDVVLDEPGLAQFYAIIDYRRMPYRLVVLSHEGTALVNGSPALPNVAVDIGFWESIEVGRYTLLLVEGQPTTAPPIDPAVVAAAGVAAAGAGLAAAATNAGDDNSNTPEDAAPATTAPSNSPMPATLPVTDVQDDIIVLDITERQWIVDVEQSVGAELSVINGGRIVAAFEVAVEGLDPDWVVVSPTAINLNEGDRAAVTLMFTPPRAPSSRAGTYHFGIVVTSPNHPGVFSRVGVSLTINPYYDFSVSDISPKRQTIPWRKHTGQVTLSLQNKGNSSTAIELEAQDDERNCSFEFQLPDQEMNLATRAEMSLLPEATAPITVTITPRKRSLFRLQKKLHSFTITARQVDNDGFPFSILGQLYTKSLFGMFHLILLLLLLAVGTYLFFQPRITQFTADPVVTRAGREVTVSWNTFPSPLITLLMDNEPVDQVSGSTAYRPIENTEYHLRADTWLSEYIPFLPYPAQEKSIAVVVTPVRPTIRLFEVSRNLINQGDAIVLSWLVSEADPETGLMLTTEIGGQDTQSINLETNTGSMAVVPETNTTYRLAARNGSSPNLPEVQWASVEILPTITPTPTASPTPIPPPLIDFFLVEPETITSGQAVTLSWRVEGVDTVAVQALSPDPLPAISPPDIIDIPGETKLYVLSANNGGGAVQAVRQIIVTKAITPTPQPAPVIEVFTITPEEGILEESLDARLDWFISGDTTNIHITGGPEGFEPLPGLPPFGNAEIKGLEETAIFILTAFNGEDVKTLQTVQIQFGEPTPTPEPEPDPTAAPAPAVTRFEALPLTGSDSVTGGSGDPPTYQVAAGSNVDLQWETENATAVTLVGVGEQAPAGNYTLFNVRAGHTYQLTAQGEQDSVDATLRLEVVAGAAPVAPYNFNGSVQANTIVLSWAYDDPNNIIGFRIYRADVPPGTFSRVVDENTLNNLTTQWTDTTLTTVCGKGYYIVGVYTDATTGDHKETDASRYSWYSDPCP